MIKLTDEKPNLKFLHNQPIIAKYLEVRSDTLGNKYLKIELGTNRLSEIFPNVKMLNISFKILNNNVPVQMEFGKVIEKRIIRYNGSSQLKIYNPTFIWIRGNTLKINCYDCFVDNLDSKRLQHNINDYW